MKKCICQMFFSACAFFVMILCACSSEKSHAEKRKEYAALDAKIRYYCEDKISELGHNNPAANNVDNNMELSGKMFSVILNYIDGDIELEYRLNEGLKKHNQYTENPDSLDYVIVLLSLWKTDYYGRGHDVSSSTEMAEVYVWDYKADTLVKKVNFDQNKNPYMVSVRKYHSEDKKIPLEEDELYEGIVKASL